MNSVCIETGWSHDYAYERYMSDINDVIYREFEYFPEGPTDTAKAYKHMRGILRG